MHLSLVLLICWQWLIILQVIMMGSCRDRGYACRPFFMMQCSDPAPEPQTPNNIALASTRAWIEITFGQLKEGVQCLCSLRITPDRGCNITVACCVLHNTATIQKERAPAVEMQPDDDLEPVHLDQPKGRAARDRTVALQTWSRALLCWHFVSWNKRKHYPHI